MGIEHTANEKSALPGIRGFLMISLIVAAAAIRQAPDRAP
jgi:hypothetical protein